MKTGSVASLCPGKFPFYMAPEPKPPQTRVSPSSKGASARPGDPSEAQLSDSRGVETTVSTAEIDRGMLMSAMSPATTAQPAAALSPAMLGAEPPSDAEIMLRAKAGDQSAFDFLVQKYRRPMVSFMYRMARNTAAAEDLAQEVFMRVYRSRASYEASAKFTTWLYRIATNLGMNYSRDTRHERPENIMNLDEPDEETGQSPDLADKTPSVEEEILHRERLTAIR